MTTQELAWDYTTLAETYSLRPPYAPRAVDQIVEACAVPRPRAADVGAGTGHLTLDLLARGCTVDAVEPNEAMRAIGMARTAEEEAVTWVVGTGEQTGLESGAYDLVTFGSSFNTTDRPAALRETGRLLRDGGRLACVWNHRQLDDPLQAEIEELVKRRIPGYSYGARREDQAPTIAASGLFGPVRTIEEPIRHRVPTTDWLAAWRSHATLEAQAGDDFHAIVDEIEALVAERAGDEIEVPYVTTGWLAERR
jgi:ubiquinone/menaquinone biosynthesis C-methylase UbiE